MLITKSDAAREMGKSRQWIDQLFHDSPRPLYFVKDGKTKSGNWIYKVDTDHPMWKAALEHYEEKDDRKEDRTREKKNKAIIPDVKIDKDRKAEIKQRAKQRVQKPLSAADEKYIDDLNKKSMLAKIEKEIYKNELTKEKSKQEAIRTLELKKEVAPIGMIKHWFSFAENLMQRLYRRPHEIGPEVKSLYMANEDRKAEQKIIRELEGIIIESWKEMIADMEKEKYKLEQEMKLHPNKSITYENIDSL